VILVRQRSLVQLTSHDYAYQKVVAVFLINTGLQPGATT
jgi:hypothetical protein